VKTYNYEAITRDGTVVTGSMEAASEHLVVDRLHEMDYYPVKVGSAAEDGGVGTFFHSILKGRVGEKDIMSLSYQLSVLLDAGFPLDRSLSILSELTEKEKLRNIIDELSAGIRGGKSLSDALSRFPEVFSPLYINMVRAGEAGGFLEDTLKRLAAYLEESQKLKDDVRSALIYPSLLGIVGGVAVVVLLVFVVPRFSSIFADMGQALPLPTLVLLSVSSALRDYWWLFAAFISGGFLLLRYYLRTEAGRRYWDRLRFRLPVLGRLYRELSVARFARTLGALLMSGVPILNALNIVEGTQQSGSMAELTGTVKEGVRKGRTIGGLLRGNAVFPPFAIHMITVGEETGKLDEMLVRIADRFDAEVRSTIKKLLSLLEPALILSMGLVVGFIVISVLLAIFSLNDLPF